MVPKVLLTLRVSPPGCNYERYTVDRPFRPPVWSPAGESSPRVGGRVLGLLTAAALMVIARRLAGALANPLEPATLLTTGILVAAAAVAIRLGWFLSPAAKFPAVERPPAAPGP